ncbi:helix-turn-helix domain-containing protein [Butyrivibrio sp. XBB1001]|uniref:helix-turn-helix domain-containing protein n=1 Tax=Butyrivibrio sp. XBB1001 TaxID=1280682 RepID=UPI00047D02C0|nr:helix-turn-helix domain-containing protein [Butyrivibrio sp. XBB1001]
MDYLTIKEVAQKWNLSERRIQTMCKDGIIIGAMRFGHSWAIPIDAERPVDKRVKTGKYIKV